MQLTAAERLLLLRYGYPFSQSEGALTACAASQDIERVPIDRFDLRQLINNLCHSIHRAKPGRLQDALFELCDRLEAAERHGDGDLDTL
jgi:hypothetical protein